MADTSEHALGHDGDSRRDFLKILTVAAGVVGAGAVAWPFIDALGPDAEGTAAAHLIVNVSGIPENSAITVTWNGLPIYIRKLTPQQIADTQAVALTALVDPATFNSRVKPGYDSYVVVVGLNTGAPCALEGNTPSDPRGPFDGWISPCDGSVYDPLGRVRGGPAAKNLTIPPFKFINDAQIQFG